MLAWRIFSETLPVQFCILIPAELVAMKASVLYFGRSQYYEMTRSERFGAVYFCGRAVGRRIRETVLQRVDHEMRFIATRDSGFRLAAGGEGTCLHGVFSLRLFRLQ